MKKELEMSSFFALFGVFTVKNALSRQIQITTLNANISSCVDRVFRHPTSECASVGLLVRRSCLG